MPKKIPVIRFSHPYRKLMDACAGTNTAQLVAVLPVNIEDLNPAFLDYDTDGGKYVLPKKGEYLLLLFRSRRGIFPTLRRAYPASKRAYYESKLGETFEVVLSDIPQPDPIPSHP